MNNSLYQDSVFRRIVVGSTGLGLACMLGSAAALRIGKEAGLQFEWHWSILLIVAAAFVWNSRFWSLIWEQEENPRETTRRKLGTYLAVLVLMGVGAFLYPITLVEQSYLGGISRGLVTALLFLGTMVTLIYKCGKGFAELDAAELRRLDAAIQKDAA